MSYRIYLLLIFVGAMICGCGKSPVERELDRAEAIIEERPDSALTLLQQIDGAALRGESQARHALLLSQAYDKNYIDLTSDSLINIALDYYAESGDNYRKMLAFHYKATIDRNIGDYSNGLFSALRAYDLAVELGDPLNMSRIESLISRLYYLTCNFAESNVWELRSIDHAKAVGKTTWVQNSYINIADNYLNQLKPAECLAYLDSVPSSAEVLELKYLSYVLLHNPAKADSIYDIFRSNNVQPPLRMVIAQAERYPHQALSLLSTIGDSAETFYAYAKAYLIAGKTDSALIYLNKHIELHNQQITSTTSNLLYHVELEYDKAKIKEKNNALRQRARVILFILLISILTIAYLRVRHKKQMIARERDREFLQQFEWINSVGNVYLDLTDTEAMRKSAMNRLNKKFDEIRHPKYQAKLEAAINANRSNLIGRLRKECPDITETEVRLIVYSVIGLSGKVLAGILGIKEQSIYNIKHRVRTKLAKHPALLAEIFADK